MRPGAAATNSSDNSAGAAEVYATSVLADNRPENQTSPVGTSSNKKQLVYGSLIGLIALGVLAVLLKKPDYQT